MIGNKYILKTKISNEQFGQIYIKYEYFLNIAISHVSIYLKDQLCFDYAKGICKHMDNASQCPRSHNPEIQDDAIGSQAFKQFCNSKSYNLDICTQAQVLEDGPA